jgi:chromosome segregation ATPase
MDFEGIRQRGNAKLKMFTDDENIPDPYDNKEKPLFTTKPTSRCFGLFSWKGIVIFILLMLTISGIVFYFQADSIKQIVNDFRFQSQTPSNVQEQPKVQEEPKVKEVTPSTLETPSKPTSPKEKVEKYSNKKNKKEEEDFEHEREEIEKLKKKNRKIAEEKKEKLRKLELEIEKNKLEQERKEKKLEQLELDLKKKQEELEKKRNEEAEKKKKEESEKKLGNEEKKLKDVSEEVNNLIDEKQVEEEEKKVQKRRIKTEKHQKLERKLKKKIDEYERHLMKEPKIGKKEAKLVDLKREEYRVRRLTEMKNYHISKLKEISEKKKPAKIQKALESKIEEDSVPLLFKRKKLLFSKKEPEKFQVERVLSKAQMFKNILDDYHEGRIQKGCPLLYFSSSLFFKI